MIDYKNLGQHLIELHISETFSTTAQPVYASARVPFGGWIRNINAKVCTTANGTDIATFDININGTSIYSGTSTQLTFTGTNGTVSYGTLGTDPPAVSAGDIITLDNDGCAIEHIGAVFTILIDKQNPGACSTVTDLSALR